MVTRRSPICRLTRNTPSTRRCAHQDRYSAISASWSSAMVNSSAVWSPDSSAWIPQMNWVNQGSTPSVRAGRSMISPNTPARPSDSARAALFGWKPISAAMARMRSRVAADTPGWPFSANDTAALVTPARRAMSAMVGRFTMPPSGTGIRADGARVTPGPPSAPAQASVTSPHRPVTASRS